MKSVFDSIELQMLRRADYMRERNILKRVTGSRPGGAVSMGKWMELGG